MANETMITKLVQYIGKLLDITADQEEPSKIDDTGVGGITYVGYAPAGTDPAAPKWRIKRITDATPLIDIEKADGDKKYDNVWNDRATLTYS